MYTAIDSTVAYASGRVVVGVVVVGAFRSQRPRLSRFQAPSSSTGAAGTT